MHLLLAFLLLGSTLPSTQVAGQPAAPPDPATILSRATRFQRGETPIRHARNFHGRFWVTLRDPDEGNINAQIDQWYTRRPERMVTRRRESLTGSVSTEGYDDGVAWFRDEQSGEVVIYSDDPEFDIDVEKLEDQLRLTRVLLEAVVLDALVPRLINPVFAGTGVLVDPEGEEHSVQYVGARLPDDLFDAPASAPPPAADDPPRLLELRLAVDADSGALWALRVAPLDREDLAPLELRFAFHGQTTSGLRVPGNIKLFRAGAETEAVNLGVDMDEHERLMFEVNVPLTLFPSFDPPQG